MIQTSPFGRTEHQSSRVIFGAAALAAMPEKRALATLDLALRYGVNHIDTAPSYGESELRLRPWLRHHRDAVFLATKTGERSYAGARDELGRSLERLGVGEVDLVQLHNLVGFDDWRQTLGPGGALEALVEAREEGILRWIGVTGHGTRVAGRHLDSLERFPFDSVLLPYNYSLMSEPTYAADFERLLAVCAERQVAVQTIKSIARRRWRSESERRFSWYEPLRDSLAIASSVRWVLRRPGIFLNTSSDATLLEPALEAASRRQPPPGDEEMADLQRTYGVEPLFVRGFAESVG